MRTILPAVFSDHARVMFYSYLVNHLLEEADYAVFGKVERPCDTGGLYHCFAFGIELKDRQFHIHMKTPTQGWLTLGVSCCRQQERTL